MTRTYRRIKTGVIRARALDNTFIGTSHIIARIGFGMEPTFTDPRKGGDYGLDFASLHGPNGFPGDKGGVWI